MAWLQALSRDPRHGPLPLLLVVLTVVSGLVDAASFLGLGHVFVANMTGNVVFIGFALTSAEFSIWASLAALASFLLGAFGGGSLAGVLPRHRARFLALGALVETALLTAAFFFTGRYSLILLLAAAMGVQTAVARRLLVPDLPTTVLTMTLAGLAADRAAPHRHRALAIVAMFIGAAAGAALLNLIGLRAALAPAVLLAATVAAVAAREWRTAAGWTASG